MSTISKALPNPPTNATYTLSAPITDSDLTIPLNSNSSLGAEGVGVVYKKDSDGLVIASTVEFLHWTSTGTNTVICSDTGDRGITGSYNGAQPHDSGDTFEVWIHPEYHFYDWAVVEHATDGSHKFTQVLDTNGNEALKLGATASAVNEVTITNAATGNPPTIETTGGDTNADLVVKAKGSGVTKKSDSRQDITTNTQNHNTIDQYGWSFITGDGSSTQIAKVITFDKTFASAPVVVVSTGGEFNSADPTAVGNMTNQIGASNHVVWKWVDVTTTTVTVIARLADGSAFTNGRRYGFSWIAKGSK